MAEPFDDLTDEVEAIRRRWMQPDEPQAQPIGMSPLPPATATMALQLLRKRTARRKP